MEEQFTEIMSPSPLSTSDLLQMDYCVNCCQCLGPSVKNIKKENYCDSYNNHNDDDSLSLQTAKSLSSIFRLHYLSAFIDSPFPVSSSTTPATTAIPSSSNITDEELKLIWNGDLNVKLCDNCQFLFTNLWKFYEDFTQLCTLESRLSQQIQKVDNCIEHHKTTRSTNTTTAKSCSSSTAVPDTNNGPFVVLRRLENDPEAQAAIVLSNQIKSPKKGLKSKKSKVKSKSKSVKSKKAAPPIKDDNIVKVEYTEKFEADNVTPIPSPQSVENDLHDDEVEEEEDYKNSASDDEDGDDSDYSDKGPKRRKKPKMTFKDEDESSECSPIKRKHKKRNSSTSLQKGHTNDRNKNSNSKPKRKKDDARIRRKKEVRNYTSRKLKVPNPCWICDKDFPTPVDCYAHTMHEHGNSEFFGVCEACSYPAISKSALMCHKKICESLMPGQLLSRYECPQCQKSLKSQLYLAEHIKNIHGERDTVHCDVEGCNFQTKHQGSLRSHKKTQHTLIPEPEEERTCRDCKAVFKFKHLYKLHWYNMHTDEGFQKYQMTLARQRSKKKESNTTKAANRTSFCTECQVDFHTHLGLRFHQKKVHPTDFPYVCENCGERFTRRDAFGRHLKFVHTDLRQFFCHFCGKSFKTSTNLTSHVQQTHDEQGRLEYNARTRLRNKRRKIISQALAQSAVTKGQGQLSTDPTFTSDGRDETISVPIQQ